MQTAEGALQNFFKAFAKLQLDEMMVWWDDDATAFFPAQHQRERINGIAAIRDAFANVIVGLNTGRATPLNLEVEDMHVQEFRGMTVITFHLHSEPLSRRTFVLRQEHNEWRIVHFHGSNAPLECSQF